MRSREEEKVEETITKSKYGKRLKTINTFTKGTTLLLRKLFLLIFIFPHFVGGTEVLVLIRKH